MYVKDFKALALKQKGKRYIFGYEVKMSDPNPKAFDCSELVQWLFHKAGVDIVDGSVNQYGATVAISGAPRIGDLFFLKYPNGRVHHVGISLGNGLVIEAKGRIWGVVTTTDAKVKARGGIWRRYKKLALKADPKPVPKPKPKPKPKPTAPTLKPIVDAPHNRMKVIGADVLNLRKKATKNSAVVGSLHRGQVVEVGANHKGWRRIIKPAGYAWNGYLELVKEK